MPRIDGQIIGAQLEEISSTNPTPASRSRVYSDITDPVAAVPRFYNGTTWKNIRLDGGVFDNIVNVEFADSPVTVGSQNGNTLYVVDTTGGIVVFNLPAIGTALVPFDIGLKVQAGTNSVTINPSGSDTIDSDTSKTLVSGEGTILSANNDSSPKDWVSNDFGGSSFTWNEVTGTTQQAAIGNGYIANNASQVVVTLPSTAPIGSIVAVTGKGAGGWRVSQNADQSIGFQDSTTVTGTSGFIQSAQRYASVELVCATEDDFWVVRNIAGIVYIGGSFPGTVKGYWMGGSDAAASGSYQDIDDIDFTSEASVTLAAVLSISLGAQAGVSSTVKGYSMGGHNSGTVSAVINALVFSGETCGAIAATLDVAKRGPSGWSSTSQGYCVGGANSGGTRLNTIENMVFSNDSSAAIGSTITGIRNLFATLSAPLAGYYAGGDTGSSIVDTMGKMIFSTEVTSTIVETLTATKYGVAGVCSLTKGWYLGGNNGSVNVAVIEDFAFSNETGGAIAATLDSASVYCSGVSGSAKGYITNGLVSSAVVDYIEDINYSNETSVRLAATIGTDRDQSAGVQN